MDNPTNDELPYEFLGADEQVGLLETQQHALEREHYANLLNLRAADKLSDLDENATAQATVARRNIKVIERKLALVKEERARLQGEAT